MDKTISVVILPRGSPKSLAEAASLNGDYFKAFKALQQAMILTRIQQMKEEDETEQRKKETPS